MLSASAGHRKLSGQYYKVDLPFLHGYVMEGNAEQFRHDPRPVRGAEKKYCLSGGLLQSHGCGVQPWTIGFERRRFVPPPPVCREHGRMGSAIGIIGVPLGSRNSN
ncbi:MAG: hypothetical protein E4H09_02210 [Spirochaetales bacterium]|nr:MAG: hypothetical protein E4H09_02210 [Spirochaetales bacterium]